MRSIRGGVGAIVLLVLLVNTSPATGQCGDGKIRPQDAIELHLRGEPLVDPNGKARALPQVSDQDKEKKKREETVVKANAEVALTMPSATQVAAPATASGGTEVTLPGIVSLLGLAQEQGLVNSKDGVTSISLTPFSFLALVRPEYVSDQELYMKASNLRRWGGTLAFGGKGESFDRDGDGEADQALETKDFNDIVTWEVKYQFGSRDRRTRENFDIFDNAIQEADLPVRMFPALAAAGFAADAALAGGKVDADGCALVSEMRKVLASPEMEDKLAALKKIDAEYTAVAKEAFKTVDAKPTLTLAVGGTEKTEGFGADKRSAALRGAFPWLGGTNAAELSWNEVESLLGLEDAVTWKLGYSYSRSFLKGSQLSKDGVTLAVAGSYEKLEDVPEAAHDTISKLNAKFSIPVTEGVEIPISVTWANHKDLITDEDEVQGHIGFTVDYSTIRDQILGRKK